MGFDISTKAPGKILWIGGYSVLERPNVSYVTGVTAYVHAHVQENTDNTVELVAPQLNCNASGTIDPASGKISTEVPKELLLMKTSAEVAARYVSSLGVRLKGFRITTNNDEAFSYRITEGKIAKSGLGSSAAVTSATINALLQAFGMDPKQDDALHKLAQTAHSIATGKVGSGFDIAAATHGSITYTRYSPSIVQSLPADYANEQLLELVKKQWDYVIEPLTLPEDLRLSFANFAGDAMITTEAVGSVSAFKKNNPDDYNKIIAEMNAENVKAIDALKAMKNGDADAYDSFKSALDAGRVIFKKLGVLSNVGTEPDDCTELIEESKRNGAFVAKLPGAGGKDAIAALTRNSTSQEKLESFWRSRKDLEIQNLSFSSVV